MVRVAIGQPEVELFAEEIEVCGFKVRNFDEAVREATCDSGQEVLRSIEMLQDMRKEKYGELHLLTFQVVPDLSYGEVEVRESVSPLGISYNLGVVVDADDCVASTREGGGQVPSSTTRVQNHPTRGQERIEEAELCILQWIRGSQEDAMELLM